MTLEAIKPTAINLKHPPKAEPLFLPDDNNFPYGWRLKKEVLADGREAYRRIPLSQSDFLNPQEGDQMVQNSKHVNLTLGIFGMLKLWYLDDSTMGVFCDMKMYWGISGLEEPAPDIAVVPNIKNKEADRSSFKVKEEGTRPCLIIEVSSPNYPGDDTDKVRIYEQAQIAEYIIINPYSGKDKTECKLTGYRLKKGKYHPIKADKVGRIVSKTLNLSFVIDEAKKEVLITDVSSGKRLLNFEEQRTVYLQEKIARLEMEAKAKRFEANVLQERLRANQAERQAEQERQRAEQERQRAERLAAKMRDLGIELDED